LTKIAFNKVGPLVSIQDDGRFGALGYGTAASGPMDRSAYMRAGKLLDEAKRSVAKTALETSLGLLRFSISEGEVSAAFCGGEFTLKINGTSKQWGIVHNLQAGDIVEVAPGASGNYAIIRMDLEFDVPKIIGSYSTNSIAHLGGFDGRLIQVNDVINLKTVGKNGYFAVKNNKLQTGPVRFIWGMHAELFSSHVRNEFCKKPFVISSMLNRMGVRLLDKQKVFGEQLDLSLVSDAIVPGDVQVLGDGTPIVLMRDHQPTGGYPRIASVISADLDRFAQLRPGTVVEFKPVTVEHAHKLLKQVGSN